MILSQKRCDSYKLKVEELQRQLRDCELFEDLIDCPVEAVEPRHDDTNMPSAMQFSSYLDNFFGEKGPHERNLHHMAERRLVSIENLMKSVTQVPVEESTILVYLELPSQVLGIIHGDSTELSEEEGGFDKLHRTLFEQSRECFNIASLSIKGINERLVQLTKKLAGLQLSFRQLVGERIGGYADKMVTLEKQFPEMPQLLKNNIFEQKHAGCLIRKSNSCAGHQREPNIHFEETVQGQLRVSEAVRLTQLLSQIAQNAPQLCLICAQQSIEFLL